LLSLQGSMDERRQTYKILRILGAGKNYVRKMIISEFACLFFLIILASVLLAKSLTYLLMKNLL
jgi:predicted lysophospholipase L1 biosynthesis ABC-type transport system permease subunit